jgi:hypothetical protein
VSTEEAKRSPRRLGIDDCRELAYCDVLARTYVDGIAALTHLGPWDELYLDHDLNAIRGCLHPTTGREMTGYDVVCFLEENPQLRPKIVKLVTSNPSGRIKMVAALKKMYGEEYEG